VIEYQNYDRKWLTELFRRKKMPKPVYFWGHRSVQKGKVTKACLSQWWPSEFHFENQLYVSAEHWMMAEKARLFGDKDIRGKILSTRKPGAAKALGRQIQKFDQSVWDNHKYDIVVMGNYHKFSQDKELKTFLVGTNTRILIEASPVDKVWGIGLAETDQHAGNPLKWKGENLLGFALMSARDALARN
jgi:ribA/ribD-fused uncharacterized protein